MKPIFETTYWVNADEKLMIKRTGPLTGVLLQVLGSDLNADFKHRHERVTFPSEESLIIHIRGLEETTFAEWENLLMELMLITKLKMELMLKSSLEQAGSLITVDTNGF